LSSTKKWAPKTFLKKFIEKNQNPLPIKQTPIDNRIQCVFHPPYDGASSTYEFFRLTALQKKARIILVEITQAILGFYWKKHHAGYCDFQGPGHL
jgi:hypothetical protein